MENAEALKSLNRPGRARTGQRLGHYEQGPLVQRWHHDADDKLAVYKPERCPHNKQIAPVKAICRMEEAEEP